MPEAAVVLSHDAPASVSPTKSTPTKLPEWPLSDPKKTLKYYKEGT